MRYKSLPEYSMSSYVFEWIEDNIPFGSLILEIGSGYSTEILSKNYKLQSIEQNPDFVGRYNSEYIYAPLLEDCFYDMSCILGKIKPYDVCIIDGPSTPLDGGRTKILEGDIFAEFRLDESKVIIVDDIDRDGDRKLYSTLCDIFSQHESFSVSNAGIIVLQKSFLSEDKDR